MKKLELILFVLLASITVNAVDKVWNFSTWLLTSGGYPAEYTAVDDLMLINPTLTSTYGVIDLSSKTINGITYTQRFKLGGSGGVVAPVYTPIQRYFAINVAGNSTITVSFVTGSIGALRSVLITDGTNIIGTLAESLGTGDICTANYIGGSKTIFIYGDASINIYQITATNISPSFINANCNLPGILCGSLTEELSSEILSIAGNDLLNPSNLKVDIYSVMGVKVEASSLSTISLSSLPSGVYIASTALGNLKFVK